MRPIARPRPVAGPVTTGAKGGGIPRYLTHHYWWAYVHPNAVRVFERQWLVNLILWGCYRQLRDAALAAIGETAPGRSLQVASVYGDLTPELAHRVDASDGSLDVVDVLPVQLENLGHKLPVDAPVRLLNSNATDLPAPDASYDRALLFFLLHEQPADVRRRTLEEVMRVVRPGGSIVIVDFSRPGLLHPLRWLWLPILGVLEPFARDLWRDGLEAWMPESARRSMRSTSYFGGLYQRLVITR